MAALLAFLHHLAAFALIALLLLLAALMARGIGYFG